MSGERKGRKLGESRERVGKEWGESLERVGRECGRVRQLGNFGPISPPPSLTKSLVKML